MRVRTGLNPFLLLNFLGCMSNDRRSLLKTMAAGIVSPAMATVAVSPTLEAAAEAPKAKTRPNVLLMICDDLGYGDLGCYGSKIPTPNLDRLAPDGMRHNSAHPICSASRASLLTGRYAPRSHTKGALFPKQAGMNREEQTMADLFRAGGYKTHCIGKWHWEISPGTGQRVVGSTASMEFPIAMTCNRYRLCEVRLRWRLIQIVMS